MKNSAVPIRFYIVSPDRKFFVSYKNGRPIKTNNISEAHEFKKVSAQNFCTNCSYKEFNGWKAVNKIEFIAHSNERKDDNIETLVSEKVCPDESDNIVKMMSSIVDNVLMLENVSKQIPAAMSATDFDVQNILHEIELSENKNAADGYKLYVKLRTALRRRRRVKNSAEFLSAMSKRDFGEAVHGLAGDIKNLKKEKRYTPRKVDESLFL